MATPLATAFVRIRPDTSGFGRELQGDLNKSGKSFSKAGEKQGGLFRKGFASSLVVGGGLAAAAGLFKFGKDSVKAFGEAQSAQTRLSDAFARFPKLADSNQAAFQRLNTELQKKTKFDDEAFASGQAVLAQFGLTGKQILGVTPLLADYAAKTGKDVPTAAKLLGKASLGNARALKDLGINFKATGNQSKDMATVIKLVQERVGGFAEKQGKEAAGQTAILGHEFEELEETAGSALVPTLLKLSGALLSIVGFIQRNSKVIGPLVAILGTFVGTLFTAVKVVGLVNVALRAMGISTTIALGPIGLIIAAIAAVTVGLILLYKRSDTFRKIVDGAFRFVWGTIKKVWEWVKRNWPLLLGILTAPIGLATILIIRNWKKIYDGLRTLVGNIRDFFTQLPGKIRGWVGALGRLLYQQGRHLIGGLWNGIKDAWSAVFSWFKGLPKRILSALGIASPPKWAIEAGKHIMAGLLKGVVPGGKTLLAFGKSVVAGIGTLFAAPTTGATRTFARGTVQLGQQLAAQLHGWTGAQWRALYDLWNNESGWNPLADNPTSTAFGIPQFLASTARAYGLAPGNTNPAAQIAAGLNYIADAYGNPLNAWQAWLSRSPHWYDKGGWLMPGATLAINKTGRPERVLSPRESVGGNSYYITVNVPANANQHEIGRVTVQAIKAYERGSGSGWRR